MYVRLEKLRRAPLLLRLAVVVGIALLRMLAARLPGDPLGYPINAAGIVATGILFGPWGALAVASFMAIFPVAIPAYRAAFYGLTLPSIVLGILARILAGTALSWLIGGIADRSGILDVVAEHTRERLMVLDRRGRVVYISRAQAETHRQQPEALEGRLVTDFMPEWFRPVATELLEGVLRGQGLSQTPIYVVSQGSKAVPVVVSAQSLQYRGEPHVLGIVQDVAGSGVAQHLYSSALDAVDMMMVLRSPDGRIIWCNQAFADTVVSDKASLVGQTTGVYGLGAEYVTAVTQQMTSNATVQGEWPLSNGRVVQATAHPILNADGTLFAFISMATDITEKKQAEARMVQAERLAAAGQVAAGVAHNLNNVLSAISANAELLTLSAPEDAARIAQQILVAVEHGSTMVHNLYEVAGCHAAPHVRAVPVAASVGAVLQLVDAQVRHAGVTAHVAVPADLLVLADESQLRQVLMNLVLNGLQAMSTGGRLTVDAAPADGGQVAIRVTDTGCGIPPADMEQIFTPFFTTKGAVNGTGLGLPTSLAMVKAMGGQLQVTSTPGAGTTVTVVLPGDTTRTGPAQ